MAPYEFYKGRKPKIYHLHVFGYKCFILNNEKNNHGKFDTKYVECFFLRYSNYSKTFRVFNKRTPTIKESINVTFNESNPLSVEVKVVDYASILKKTSLEDKDQDKNQNQEEDQGQTEEENIDIQNLHKEWRTVKDHPI